jgi:PleD family two-component response regulator
MRMEHAFEQPDFADDPQSQTGHVDPDEPTLVRGRIAVVEDGEATRHFLVQALRAQGYAVKGIEDGGSALPLLRLHLPDIILLDVTLPGLSGFDVCRQIRADPFLRRATVILLTGRAGGSDRAEGWHAGADDYMVKPCDFPELLARVDAHMRHREAPQRQWRNPITRLPAAAALEADLAARLAHGEPFALCYADITYFKSYNNRYGYVAGDGLLVVLADLLREIAAENEGTAGHLGSDDFVIVTAPEHCTAAAQALGQRFSEIAPMLYHGVDRARGWVPEADHDGAAQRMPLVQLAIATLACQPGDIALDTTGQVPGGIISPLWDRLRAATHPLHGMDQTG